MVPSSPFGLWLRPFGAGEFRLRAPLPHPPRDGDRNGNTEHLSTMIKSVHWPRVLHLHTSTACHHSASSPTSSLARTRRSPPGRRRPAAPARSEPRVRTKSGPRSSRPPRERPEPWGPHAWGSTAAQGRQEAHSGSGRSRAGRRGGVGRATDPEASALGAPNLPVSGWIHEQCCE